MNYIEHNGLKKAPINNSWRSQKHWLEREIQMLNYIHNSTISRGQKDSQPNRPEVVESSVVEVGVVVDEGP